MSLNKDGTAFCSVAGLLNILRLEKADKKLFSFGLRVGLSIPEEMQTPHRKKKKKPRGESNLEPCC